MTVEPTKEASGQPDENASGDSREETPDNNTEHEGDEEKPPKKPSRGVSYESHQKLLAEKKKLQAKLAEIEAERVAKERQTLEEQGRYKELAELAKKEAEDAKKQLAVVNEQRTQAKKLSAVLKSVGGTIHQKFFDLIPIDDVLVNPDSGEIDELSVAKVVEGLRKSYPEIIAKGTPGMPQHAPKGGGGATISYEEWRKLPPKEMDKWKIEQIIG